MKVKVGSFSSFSSSLLFSSFSFTEQIDMAKVMEVELVEERRDENESKMEK